MERLEQQHDAISADKYNYVRFKLNGSGRSKKWETYLYGDQTMVVKRQNVEVLSCGVVPPGIGGVGSGTSPNLGTITRSTSCVCCPNEPGMDVSMHLADPDSGDGCGGTRVCRHSNQAQRGVPHGSCG